MQFYPSYAALSDSQKRFWFLQQIHPSYVGHNISCVLKICGPLNIRILEESVNKVLQRHNIFQATYPFVDGKPIQVLKPLPYQFIDIHKLEDIPQQMKESEAARLMTAAVKNPFDLKQGPLIRFTLFYLGHEVYLFLMVIHQIICDIYSSSIIFKEIINFYQSISVDNSLFGSKSSDISSDISFIPPFLDPDQMQDSLSFWEKQLRDLPVLELPTDWSRPPIQTYHGSTQSLLLSVNVYEALYQFSLQREVDVPLIILGVLQSLFYRYTHQSDLAVGYAIPGRTWPDAIGRIGSFENFLVLRTKFSEASSFRQLITNLKNTFDEAVAHQGVPFAKIVRNLQVDRDLTRTPLFQILFRYMADPAVHAQVQDLLFVEYEVANGVASHDLTLKILPQGDSIHCFFNYNTDLFSSATITRLIGHFETLLKELLASPEEPISILPILTADERQRMIVEWNDTATPYAKDLSLDKIFEAQASRAPQAMALDFNGRQLTYGQLDAAANQLARFLIKLGVGPQIPVGIGVEPSATMIIGMLGILKAGGCYVPLDLEYPQERIAFMLEDTQARVLITRQGLMKNLPGLDIPTILFDEDQELIARESIDRVAVEVNSSFPACIFYTSGSTGRPKGVPVPHYAINRLVCLTNYVQFLPSDKVAQASNISFDGATFEIWGALLNGGCLVGLPKDVLLSPVAMADFLRGKNINVLFLTPALFHQCAREVPDAFQTIRDLVMGGEVLEPRWVREVMMHGPPARILNAYGPTECTTFATWYEVPELPSEDRSIPIGRPISNATIYILDRNLQPVPIGITGEIYIGGDGLALGYLRRPEQTAEKFIPNPFHPDSGSRLYRTGDLGRFLPDGNVEFLGRIDHQIKIRGFRIEPGEIEIALKRYPGVQEALVVVREAEPGDKRLLAYLVTSQKSTVTGEALRNFLHDLLPPYMIPAFFVFLEQFSLTPNGKIDRQALPDPDLSELIPSTGHVGPRDEVEKQLTEVWEKVLGVQSISVFDDFFALGGHSLLGARLFIQLEKLFGRRIPLYVLYQRPTIDQLAEVLRDRHLLDDVRCSVLEPISLIGKNLPLFLISMRDALHSLKKYLSPEQNLYHLISPLELRDSELIKKGIKGIATNYLSEMRRVQPKGPYLLGGFSAGGVIAIEIAHQLLEQDEKVAFLFLLDPTPPKTTRLNVTKVHFDYIFKNFMELPQNEKLPFLIESTSQRIKRTIVEAFRRNVVPMPRVLYKFLAAEVILAMLGEFFPEPVRCRTLLIQCFHYDYAPEFNWSDILLGPLEVHTFQTKHVRLRQQVDLWARYLQKNLKEIQRTT